jgi:hypothetical protein
VTIATMSANGTLQTLLAGLNPGDALTPQQIEQLGKDPNNLPLFTVYNVSNSNGSDTTAAPLVINFPPLSPGLPQTPPSIAVAATNATGTDATGFIPDALASYIGMGLLPVHVLPFGAFA